MIKINVTSVFFLETAKVFRGIPLVSTRMGWGEHRQTLTAVALKGAVSGTMAGFWWKEGASVKMFPCLSINVRLQRKSLSLSTEIGSLNIYFTVTYNHNLKLLSGLYSNEWRRWRGWGRFTAV